jgi:hypothetical protein
VPPTEDTGTGKVPATVAPRARKTTPKASANRTKRSYGQTERAVRADVAALRAAGTEVQESLAQMAYHLARKLDDDAGLATAAVARELRATLTAFTPKEEADDGDDLAGLLAALSSPVEHPKV